MRFRGFLSTRPAENRRSHRRQPLRAGAAPGLAGSDARSAAHPGDGGASEPRMRGVLRRRSEEAGARRREGAARGAKARRHGLEREDAKAGSWEADTRRGEAVRWVSELCAAGASDAGAQGMVLRALGHGFSAEALRFVGEIRKRVFHVKHPNRLSGPMAVAPVLACRGRHPPRSPPSAAPGEVGAKPRTWVFGGRRGRRIGGIRRCGP